MIGQAGSVVHRLAILFSVNRALVNQAFVGSNPTRGAKSIESGKTEIRPGLSNILYVLRRIAPRIPFGQMAKMLPAARRNGPAIRKAGIQKAAASINRARHEHSHFKRWHSNRLHTNWKRTWN
jgi:hypothetical protein